MQLHHEIHWVINTRKLMLSAWEDWNNNGIAYQAVWIIVVILFNFKTIANGSINLRSLLQSAKCNEMQRKWKYLQKCTMHLHDICKWKILTLLCSHVLKLQLIIYIWLLDLEIYHPFPRVSIVPLYLCLRNDGHS